MRPPVALLVYAPDEPRVATFYPFAEFSPEWVALRWALAHGIPARFIDLAAGAQFAVAKAEFERRMAEAAAAATPNPRSRRRPRTAKQGRATDARHRARPPRPAHELAQAAGEEDGERFWDRLVESRRDPADLFAAVSEAMTAVRGALPSTTASRSSARRRCGAASARRRSRASRTSLSCAARGTHPLSRSCRPPPKTIGHCARCRRP